MVISASATQSIYLCACDCCPLRAIWCHTTSWQRPMCVSMCACVCKSCSFEQLLLWESASLERFLPFSPASSVSQSVSLQPVWISPVLSKPSFLFLSAALFSVIASRVKTQRHNHDASHNTDNDNRRNTTDEKHFRSLNGNIGSLGNFKPV